jgi:hypothetical protein
VKASTHPLTTPILDRRKDERDFSEEGQFVRWKTEFLAKLIEFAKLKLLLQGPLHKNRLTVIGNQRRLKWR